MSGQTCIRLEKKGHTALIYMDDPKTLNAFLLEDIYAFNEILEDCEKDNDLRCAVITGGGKAFMSGGNLKAELDLSINAHDKIEDFNLQGVRLVKSIRNSRLPFIAAVNGYAFGAAMALIVACDFALAAKGAVFGCPTTALGGIPGWSCTQAVGRTIGAQNLKRMLLLDERFDAGEALRIGLVHKVLPEEELLPAALSMAAKMSAYAPEVLASAKALANRSIYSGYDESFADENEQLRTYNTRANFQEGIAAFLAKRPAEFK